MVVAEENKAGEETGADDGVGVWKSVIDGEWFQAEAGEGAVAGNIKNFSGWLEACQEIGGNE